MDQTTRIASAMIKTPSWSVPRDRHDLNACVEQPPQDDPGRSLGVQDLRGKVATTEQIDEHVFGKELSICRHDRASRFNARSMNRAAPSSVKPLATV
jgi:hypothetical protein